MKLATIGFFDGVHRGHLHLLSQVHHEAEKRHLEPFVVTFADHPRRVLHSDYQPQLLTTIEEKLTLLRAALYPKASPMGGGWEGALVIPFTEELAHLTARQFMQKLHDNHDVRALLIGYDHRFGAGRTDGFEDYVRYGREIGIEVIQASESPDGKYSSTIVRHALADGDVEKANDTLGYRYFLEGTVVHGFHNGTAIGFPTANIQLPDFKLIPRTGVYAVEVQMPDGTVSHGMLNIGTRPTLSNGPTLSVEVNIFDYSGELYGSTLRVSLIHFLRPEQRFDSLDFLRIQLERDKEACKRICNIY